MSNSGFRKVSNSAGQLSNLTVGDLNVSNLTVGNMVANGPAVLEKTVVLRLPNGDTNIPAGESRSLHNEGKLFVLPAGAVVTEAQIVGTNVTLATNIQLGAPDNLDVNPGPTNEIMDESNLVATGGLLVRKVLSDIQAVGTPLTPTVTDASHVNLGGAAGLESDGVVVVLKYLSR